MKKTLFLSGLCLFGGCDPTLDPTDSKRVPKVTVRIDQSSIPLDISVINKDEKGYINLSNEIVFHGFSESGQFVNKPLRSKKLTVSEIKTFDETLAKMKISTVCTTERAGRFIRNIYLKRYNFQFAVMDLIPPALFFQEATLSSSCSFFFEVKDKAEGVHRFSLKQLPLASISESKILEILDSGGRDISSLGNRVITAEDMNDFFLISEDPRPGQSLAVFCDKAPGVMEFPDIPAVPFFRLLYSGNKSLPKGMQNCRALSRKGYKSTGITKVFQIDFDTFHRKAPAFKLSELGLNLVLTPPERLFEPGKWLSHSIAKDRFLGLRYKKLKPDDTLLHLLGVFEPEGLPEDFFSMGYSPVKTRVETQCVSEAFPEKSVEGRFDLDLISPVSLMSVTPLEVFQMDYPANKPLPNVREDGEMIKKPWAILHENHQNGEVIKNEKALMKCSYNFSFQDLMMGAKLAYRPLEYQILWRAGGLGVGYDHGELRMGIPSFYEELVSEGAGNILFPFQSYLMSYPPHIRPFLKPDSIVFRCGRGLKNHKKDNSLNFFQAELSGGEVGFSLPLSVFLSDPDFKEHIGKQQFVKCRTLLYREGTLLYFSPEIQILRKERLRRIMKNRRRIKYPKNLEDDVVWDSLQKFFFIL